MDSSNFISSKDICIFLGVSKPTWNKLRAEHQISGVTGKRRLVMFDKAEVIKKIISKKPSTPKPVDLMFSNDGTSIETIKLDETTFDLRAVNRIDPYGALALLASVRALVSEGKAVNLIIDFRFPTLYLAAVGIFNEFERSFDKFVFWDKSITKQMKNPNPDILYPLKVIGYKGQDKTATEELTQVLLDQQFSETIAAYIGWILGELTDNSLTHSGGSCYILATRYPGQKNYLHIGILDHGIGIQNSLRKNIKHQELSDQIALLSAFKPFVSSWSEEAKRGKGLTDVVNIALSNKSFFKVDSCDLSLLWDFTDMRREVHFSKPITSVAGVRFSFIMIDSEFELQAREQVDEMINKKLEEFCDDN